MDSSNQNSKSRELKYVFPSNAKTSLLATLNFKCQQDKKYAYNNIHSLYFDNSDYQLAMEKASSDYCKSKVRIRWYITPDNAQPTQCWLEIKNKLGSTRNKVRILIPGNLENILTQLHHRGAFSDVSKFIQKQIQIHKPELVSANLKPVFSVSYRRHRYYDPFSDSRIACDSDIIAKAFETNTSFITSQTKLNTLILEVKGKHEALPPILRSLSLQGLKKAAFSKYYECFTNLTGYEQ